MSVTEAFRNYFFLHFEWIALISGLLLMILLDPFTQAPSICPLDRLGFDFCPGCGLGKSIAFAARGNVSASFQSHPLGLFAILVIISRIGSIFHRNYKFKKQAENEEST